MCECSSRSRVSQVVRRNVDRLYGRDGAFLGRGDTLLQSTHLGRKGRLITNGGGHTAQQRGNLGTCLCETEDVVDEQQHVLTFLIAEVLRHSQTGKCDSHSCSRRLVHLTVNQRGLVDNAGLGHLVVEVVALAGTLANAGEYGNTAVLFRDVVDKFHDEDGLTNAGAAEQTYLTALEVRRDKVNDLDAGLQHLVGSLLLLKLGGRAVDLPLFFGDGLRLVVNSFAEQVEDTAEGLLSDRDLDRRAGIHSLHASNEAVGGTHRNAAHDIVADMLSDLNDQLLTVVVDLDGIKQIGQMVGVELDIKHRTDDCHDRAYVLICHTVIFPFHLMWLEITRRTMHFVHCTPGVSAARTNFRLRLKFAHLLRQKCFFLRQSRSKK